MLLLHRFVRLTALPLITLSLGSLTACSKLVKLGPGTGASPSEARSDAPDTKATSTDTATGIDTGSESADCKTSPGKVTAPLVSNRERLITILATNDVHGAVEPRVHPERGARGGLAFWAGATQSIHQGIRRDYGCYGGTVTVDAGDQFQGTLVSNFSEGVLVFDAFNQVGYDAVVPGNHDYDFGPIGWKEDQPRPGAPESGKEVIRMLAARAKFPLISANTYLKTSLTTFKGRPVSVKSAGCAPVDGSSTSTIRWASAQRPDFLRPYHIKEVSGVRVAMVGLDHHQTASMTTAANVSDLCFRDSFETLVDLRADLLRERADLVVLVIHDGVEHSKAMVSRFLNLYPGEIHAVINGHTHRGERDETLGIPMIQNGAHAEAFGRIDLVYDLNTRKVINERRTTRHSLTMDHDECFAGTERFCKTTPEQAGVSYGGVKVEPSSTVLSLIQEWKSQLSSEANRRLGQASQEIRTDRINESALANLLTDALRETTQADIAMMNTGGIRTSIKSGILTYEKFFEILPFNNRAVRVYPVSRSRLMRLVKRSIETCGDYGALMQSGLRVRFTRNCPTEEGAKKVDLNASILSVRTLDGTELDTSLEAKPGDRDFRVATLDFLIAGGSGYEFGSFPEDGIEDLGIARDLIADGYFGPNRELTGTLDGRWQKVVSTF